MNRARSRLAERTDRFGRRSYHSTRGWGWIAIVGLLLSGGTMLLAADGPAPPGSVIEFRREFVASERLAEFAREHLPIRETEFNQLLADATRRAQEIRSGVVGCARAEYSARFENDALVAGRAVLDVYNGSAAPAPWTWRDTNVPVRNPQWKADPPRAASLGLAASGAQTVLVEGSATLIFDWTLRGQRVSRDSVSFSLRLPHGAFQALTLDLPSSLVPSCRDAIVQRELAPPDAAAKDPSAAPATNDPSGSRVFWRIQWQGDRPLELRLAHSAARRGASSPARVRQDLTYSIDPRGLEFQADLHIDVSGQPLQNLVLAIDRRLRISAVRLGDKPLTWTRHNGSDSSAQDELVVQIPELAGDDRWIQCLAVAPAELGTPWKLPALQPRDLLWLEGEAQITVHEPLVATHLDARGGRLVGQAGATAERRRSWRVRLQDPDAQCTLIADVPPPRLRVRCGTSLSADVGTLAARCMADLTPVSGLVYALEAELPRAWLLDGVESLAGPVVEEFQLPGVTPQGRQLLRLRLREPLAAGKTLRLAVRAHRASPSPNAPIGIDQLRMLRFREQGSVPHEVEQFVAILDAPNTRLRFSGDQGVQWLEPDKVAEATDLLDELAGGGRVFRATRAAENLEVRFERDRPRFRAQLEVTARVRGERLVEMYRLRLIPEASVLDRVPVYFTRARSSTMHWRIEAPRELAASFRRLAAAGEAAEPGETWEVAFPRPYSGAVTLTAERTSLLAEATTVSLVSLPDATEQSGQLRLAAHAGAGRWVNGGLRPIIQVPEAEAAAAAKLLGAVPGTVTFFEYEPTSGGAASVTRESDPPLLARVWAAQASLTTTAVPDGTVRHHFAYDLENVGAPEITFAVPPSLRLRRLLLDGVEHTPLESEANREGKRREIRCALPVGQRAARVELDLTAQDSVFAVFHQLDMPQVTTSFPVLEQRWAVNLPREWSVWRVATPATTTAGLAAEYDVRQLWPLADWSHRLFGLLLRDKESPSLAGAASTAGWEIDAPGDSAPRLGWHAFQLRVAPGEPVALRSCRASVVRAFAWAALLLTAALLGALEARGRRFWPWIVLTAGLVALAAPHVWAVVAGGVFLGTLIAPLFAAGLHRLAPERTRPVIAPEATTMTAPGLVTALLVAVFAAHQGAAGGWIRAAVGQEAPREQGASATGDPRVIYRVLIPVDEQRKRVGDYVHVPREFYRELRRQAGLGEAAATAFLIQAASYDATLRGGENPLLDIVAQYDLQTRQPDARISWPFARGQATLIETRVTQAGESVETDWQAEESGWSTSFPRPGSYRVYLRLHIPIAAGATSAGLAIPPVADSQVQLRAEETAARLELTNEACGPVEVGAMGERRLSLGPAPRLTFQWSVASDLPVATSDQLYWLNVRPGSVQLDFSMRLAPAMIPASRILRLRHDPQLRLLPVVGSQTIVRAQPAAGQAGVLLVEVTESDEPLDVRLSFLLSRSNGVGRIVVPQLEWLDGRSERRWVAVTVAATLELSRQEGAALEPLQVPAFLQAWGPTDTLPLAAYRLVPEEEAAVLAIRQRDTEWTASETSSYLLRRNRGELVWWADVSVGIGPLFQHQVQRQGAPRILEVELTEGADQTPRPVRWAVDSQGTLQILAEQGLFGVHRVRVRADFALPPDKETPLPCLVLAAPQPSARTAVVERTDAVLVDQITLDGWTPLAPTDAPPQVVRWDDASHQVGAWTWGTPTAAGEPTDPVVRLRLNRPRTRGRLLVSLTPESASPREHDSWQVTVAGWVQVDQGRIERLRVEIPVDWKGPWEPDEAEQWTQRTPPGQGRSQLERTVGRAATAPLEFLLRGPWEFSRQERVRAPDIQLLDALAVDRYLALPTQHRGRKIVWETSGLRTVVQPDRWLADAAARCQTPATAPPADAAEEPSGAASAARPYLLYQIVAPRFQATVSAISEESPQARVLHAKHELHPRPAGGGWGQTTLATQSGGLRDCLVDLPQTAQLVQVRVGGELAVVARDDDGGWRIPLADSFAPQEIQLLYQLPPAARTNTRKNDELLPRVRQWPTDHSELQVVGRTRPVAADGWHWLAAVVLLAVTLAGVGLRHWHGWQDWLAGGPALPAVLIGIGWWLWCEPQFLGVLIALTGILVANRSSNARAAAAGAGR